MKDGSPWLAIVPRSASGECPIRSVLDRVGDKWSVLIFVALKDEAKRFNEIKRLIGDISQRVLTSNFDAGWQMDPDLSEIFTQQRFQSEVEYST